MKTAIRTMRLRRTGSPGPATLFDPRVDAALATPAHLRSATHYADLHAALAEVGTSMGPLQALDDITLMQAAPALVGITGVVLLVLLVLGFAAVRHPSAWWLLMWVPIALVGGLAATVGLLVAQESRRRQIAAAVADGRSLAAHPDG